MKAFGGGGGALSAARSASLLWLDFCDLERRVFNRFTCKQKEERTAARTSARDRGDRVGAPGYFTEIAWIWLGHE